MRDSSVASSPGRSVAFPGGRSPLAANIAALGERNADLAAKLDAAAPAPGLVFAGNAQGVPVATLDGRQLCSRHRPSDEAKRLAETVDLLEHAVTVVLGFGLGYHVQRLAERLGSAGVIVVFEPDVALLRGVFERIDHSAWLGDAVVVWITDPLDRAALAGKLQGGEALIAQGVSFLEHAAHRARLGEEAPQFTATFREFVKSAKVTLMTTLIRSVETVRNLLLNLDHYAAGPGLADLKGAAAGRPAVVVSAGPSLARNLPVLSEPSVAERCLIVATQTTLRPLLDAGVRPHFVTALDYHEISRRFYEGLDGHDLSSVTLVAEPKAHPVILDAFPGPVRCCQAGFCDRLLGDDLRRDMGELPAGATVAHLAAYLARFLGCDPIVLIGQDLGFSDGLYYAPGTAIEDVWAPELSPFNTMEMMQWQRIARHRLHLHKTTDVHGRSIYTDAQMLAYQQQFERDFAEFASEGLTVIDATEGGVPKQHAKTMPLAGALRRWAVEPLPALPLAPRALDADRMRGARQRVAALRRDVTVLRRSSLRTAELIRAMLDDQDDPARMRRHFAAVEKERRQVGRRLEALELLNHLNQMGVFKRFRADRRLQVLERRGAEPRAMQRAQLERDLENVVWIADSAEEFAHQLAAAERLVAGEAVSSRPRPVVALAEGGGDERGPRVDRVAALIPVDPERSGLGVARPLDEPAGRSLLQATLERVARCPSLECIVLVAPRHLDLDALVDADRLERPLVIERVEGSPFPPEQAAIAAARAWSDHAWRGGVAGMSVFDEILSPRVMSGIMAARGYTAALIVGPDWPLLDVSAASGCEAVIRRHLEQPDRQRLVFTQAPPGLCGCVVSAGLMQELADRSRLATIGALLVHQPHAPQGDPIARDANVQIDAAVRGAMTRLTADLPERRRRLAEALAADPELAERAPASVVAAVTAPPWTAPWPRHVILELTGRRASSGLFARRRGAGPEPGDLPLELARRLLEQLADRPDTAVTLDGRGDPVLHDHVHEIVETAIGLGLRHVHVRTELLGRREDLERLADCGVEVISVDLHADRAATYEIMMGSHERFREVLITLGHLVERRPPLAGPRGAAAMALPWIVPRLQRCRETHEDLDSFFERWTHQLGACVIEPMPPGCDEGEDRLAPTLIPAPARLYQLQHRMTVLSDGSVPVSETDRAGRHVAGSVGERPVDDMWSDLLEARRRLAEAGRDDELQIWPV